MYKIIFYTDKNGKSELYDYIKKLRSKNDKDSKIKLNKIISYINKISEYGLVIEEPYIKHLEENIWELRPLRDRILFGYWNNNTFILLNFFMKQTRKTPRKEIEKAKKMIEDYKNRSGV